MAAAAADRRNLLRKLLERREARTQAELLEALRARGVASSQPVLSRDLRALGAVKAGGAYALPEEDARVTPLEELRSLLRSARAAGPHLVVIATEPGGAHPVARALEAAAHDGVAGVLAGDDTIFVALSSEKARRRVLAAVRRLI